MRCCRGPEAIGLLEKIEWLHCAHKAKVWASDCQEMTGGAISIDKNVNSNVKNEVQFQVR